jgi:hypothetical protein
MEEKASASNVHKFVAQRVRFQNKLSYIKPLKMIETGVNITNRNL